MFYLYLFCTLLARGVLRCLLTHCRPFWLRKCFTGTFYFLKAGETYIHRKRKATKDQFKSITVAMNKGNFVLIKNLIIMSYESYKVKVL